MTESSGSNGVGNDDNGSSGGGGEVTALHDLIAGGVAGSASVVVGHPFDTIKVRLQTSASPTQSSSSVAGASPYSFQSLFKGMAAPLSTAAVVNAIIFGSYGSFTRVWENLLEDGRHDEVHGTMTAEGGVFIDRAGDEHGIHEQLKGWEKKAGGSDVGDSSPFETDSDQPSPHSRRRQQDEGTDQRTAKQAGPISPDSPSAPSAGSDNAGVARENANTLKVFMCGAAAGTVQAFVICPMEHIKCRLQVQQSSLSANSAVAAAANTTTISSAQQRLYKGPVDCCLSITKNYGFFNGLYRGMGVTLWRETPAFGLYFATYDTIKSRVEAVLQERDGRHPIPSHAHAWAASALAGGISGAWTWAVIYPFDVIKSRIQTGSLEGELRRGMWTVARDIVEECGWRHMFRGLGVTLARAFPVNAIIFPVYEFVLVQLGDGG